MLCKEQPEYFAWHAMMSRCYRKYHQSYRNYGARGITVCSRWHSYENFLADMGRRPSTQHSLDRIDNDGNYEPDNCRWATYKEQQRNKRTSAHITIDGRTQTVSDWADEMGVSRNRIQSRINIGWDPKDAVLQPPKLSRDAFPVGTIFGAWTVVGDPQPVACGSQGKKRRYYPCRCMCGQENLIRTDALRSGRSASCHRCSVQRC